MWQIYYSGILATLALSCGESATVWLSHNTCGDAATVVADLPHYRFYSVVYMPRISKCHARAVQVLFRYVPYSNSLPRSVGQPFTVWCVD